MRRRTSSHVRFLAGWQNQAHLGALRLVFSLKYLQRSAARYLETGAAERVAGLAQVGRTLVMEPATLATALTVWRTGSSGVSKKRGRVKNVEFT